MSHWRPCVVLAESTRLTTTLETYERSTTQRAHSWHREACRLHKDSTCHIDSHLRPQETTAIMTPYIEQLLRQYAEDPESKWQLKNCALFCATALAVQGRTAAQGATAVNDLVAVPQFAAAHVLPELAEENVNARPVIKADCLRCALRWLLLPACADAVHPSQRRISCHRFSGCNAAASLACFARSQPRRGARLQVCTHVPGPAGPADARGPAAHADAPARR